MNSDLDRQPGRQPRSDAKRTDILDAAEALFVAYGYERPSVDAIAARANVSKRTIYNQFDGKQALFEKVLERVHETLVAIVRSALDEELSDPGDLRASLIAFARRVTIEALPSADYVKFRRLTLPSTPRELLPASVRIHPETLLEERFAQLAAEGHIATEEPRTAARHFTALTIRLVLEESGDGEAFATADGGAGKIIADGVDAFLRAYGTR
ncbi:TetR/AcrR family transcriptional regulator [Pseudoroseicyclus sp. CXY001]|uniref:TetR/AcrR family transcriptional regulator n=1 Tax=Pseudoroseicyclus sp. CXY001 TaxID=3242492 RepID=UPI00357134CC